MKVIRRRKKGKFYLAALVVLLGGYAYWTLGRPLPLLYADTGVPRIEALAAEGSLAWPARGQAAVSIVGTDILETHGGQTPAPIASTAKLITVLTVLRDKPLKINEHGPLITLSANDVALYSSYVARSGSVVPVAAGEKISQYQMLQAIMLPSANNMADSLAIWAYGSLETYSKTANAYLAELRLKNTKVGTDASGLAPSTTSTAGDLVKLGKIAMQNPVLAQIASQSTATGLPVVNTINNTNHLLGIDNIIGIKTGNTDEAGGVFISASKVTVNQKPVIIVTSVLGEADIATAMRSSQTLVRSAQANFKPIQVVKAGSVIGSYTLPWGGEVKSVASQDLSLSTWAGSSIETVSEKLPITPETPAGQTVGSLRTKATAIHDSRAIPLTLQKAPTTPTNWWRLTHP